MRRIKILEMNVDDEGYGGVFSLIKSVIINKPNNISIDIAGIEKFENKDNIKLLNEHGSNVYYVGHEGNKLIKQLAIIKKSRALIKKNKYDVVHVHADVAYKLLIPGIAAKTMRVPQIIFHSHATGIDGDRRFLKKVFHYISKPLLKFVATDYATCSDLAAKWMFFGNHKKTITYINNGIDLKKFRYNAAVREQIRDELRVSDKLVVGHVGRFAYQKNHEYLIRVFKEIHEQRNDSILYLIGEGPLLEDIKKLVKKLGLQESVVFAGLSNRVNDIMQAFDVFLLPSRYEGLPVAGVEAEAAGIPVLFSDTITKEAKLISDVEYLSTDESSIIIWAKKAIYYAEKEKKDTYLVMKEKRFDIKDTVNQFYKLYSK